MSIIRKISLLKNKGNMSVKIVYLDKPIDTEMLLVFFYRE